MNLKKLLFILLTGAAVIATSVYWLNNPKISPSENWDTTIQSKLIESKTSKKKNLYSSTKVLLSWEAAEKIPDHYEIITRESTNNTRTEISGEKKSHTLTGLKAATTYSISVKACFDSGCNSSILKTADPITTPEEVWQLQGKGNSFENASRILEEGNVLSYAITYGKEAGPKLEGATKYWGKTSPLSKWGAGISAATQTREGNSPEALSSFKWTYNGLKNNCDPTAQQCKKGDLNINAFQLLPLASKEAMRLCFEAQKAESKEGRTSIYCIESQDGYIGEDFSKDPKSSICGDKKNDYKKGGECELDPTIGEESGLKHARQFKIGFPKRNSWLWDESTGTFMIITGADNCGKTTDGLFYAKWDGENWIVEKDEGNCPKPLVPKAHGPVIVHLGDNKYKAYYEDSSMGKMVAKPFRSIYADGSLTGSPDIIDFDDWENWENSREVQFLWPDGSKISEDEEAGLGDHFINLPNNNPEYQIMYVNLGGKDNLKNPGASKGIGMAILLNP